MCVHRESAARYEEQTVTRGPSQTFCLNLILVTSQEDSARQHPFVRQNTDLLGPWPALHPLSWLGCLPIPEGPALIKEEAPESAL